MYLTIQQLVGAYFNFIHDYNNCIISLFSHSRSNELLGLERCRKSLSDNMDGRMPNCTEEAERLQEAAIKHTK
jgi:hypothetical protein